MKNILWILAGFLLLTSCSRTEYMVEGNSTIQTLDGKKLYLKAYKDNDKRCRAREVQFLRYA